MVGSVDSVPKKTRDLVWAGYERVCTLDPAAVDRGVLFAYCRKPGRRWIRVIVAAPGPAVPVAWFERGDQIVELGGFRDSLSKAAPPEGLGNLLLALWHEAKGDWNRAHEIVQNEESRNAAWVHAYLHRREGDLSNAGYWYRRAGRPIAENALDEEWEALATALL